MNLKTIIERVDRVTAWLESAALGAGILLMAINTLANVVGRYFFDHALVWSEEVNQILIIVITFAGLGYAARHGRHIRMSAIFEAVPESTRKRLIFMISAVTALFMFGLAVFSFIYLRDMMTATTPRRFPGLNLPVYWAYLWVPVGFAVAGIQYTLTVLRNHLEDDVYLSSRLKEADEHRN